VLCLAAQDAPVSRTATSSYIVPLVAVFAGWLVLGEHIGPLTIVGAAVIVASVAVTAKTDRGHVAETSRRPV
jgi:drug/metabolite transporter (DMT)-like permease